MEFVNNVDNVVEKIINDDRRRLYIIPAVFTLQSVFSLRSIVFMSPRARRWLPVFLAIGLIYSTLAVIPKPIAVLRSHGLLRMALRFLYGGSAIGFFVWFYRRGVRDWWRYAALVLLFGFYGRIASHVPLPEEQIHFFEYGFLAIFWARALECDLHSSAAVFIAALLLSTLAGWLDEWLQGLTPGRHYDLKDVGLNAVSAFMGLILHAFSAPPSKTQN
jgi:hypothetical protein